MLTEAPFLTQIIFAIVLVFCGIGLLWYVRRNETADAQVQTKEFELVQVHECGSHAEVVIRQRNGCLVYAGNLNVQPNPKAYYLPSESLLLEEAP